MKLEHLSIHGHRLGVYVAGTGPVVLLIHGMAGSSATWRHVAPALAERFTVVAPDLIGHGASGKPRRGEYSLAAHANVLRDLLHFLGHERARSSANRSAAAWRCSSPTSFPSVASVWYWSAAEGWAARSTCSCGR
jgi:pimeloyl-ACP methyl ester carboxylesterase